MVRGLRTRFSDAAEPIRAPLTGLLAALILRLALGKHASQVPELVAAARRHNKRRSWQSGTESTVLPSVRGCLEELAASRPSQGG